MQKLGKVEAAKILMTEAQSWSVMMWLRKKKKVRKTADEANAALDELRETVAQSWPADLRSAYDELASKKNGNGAAAHFKAGNGCVPPKVKHVKDADDAARQARADAEQTFDIAEKQLSTMLAREGCRKAIHSWELHELAISKAEAAIAE
jgi:hypothetical protein